MSETASSAQAGAMKYVVLWFRIYFGMHLLYSAMRYLLHFDAGVGPSPDSVGGQFVAAITVTGIYHAVKIIELIVGAMLIANLFVPLALVIEMPISIVIFILNFLIVGTGRQLFSGPQEVILNVLMILFYGRYYAPLFKFNPVPRPLWTIKRSDIEQS